MLMKRYPKEGRTYPALFDIYAMRVSRRTSSLRRSVRDCP